MKRKTRSTVCPSESITIRLAIFCFVVLFGGASIGIGKTLCLDDGVVTKRIELKHADAQAMVNWLNLTVLQLSTVDYKMEAVSGNNSIKSTQSQMSIDWLFRVLEKTDLPDSPVSAKRNENGEFESEVRFFNAAHESVDDVIAASGDKIPVLVHVFWHKGSSAFAVQGTPAELDQIRDRLRAVKVELIETRVWRCSTEDDLRNVIDVAADSEIKVLHYGTEKKPQSTSHPYVFIGHGTSTSFEKFQRKLPKPRYFEEAIRYHYHRDPLVPVKLELTENSINPRGAEPFRPAPDAPASRQPTPASIIPSPAATSKASEKLVNMLYTLRHPNAEVLIPKIHDLAKLSPGRKVIQLPNNKSQFIAAVTPSECDRIEAVVSALSIAHVPTETAPANREFIERKIIEAQIELIGLREQHGPGDSGVKSLQRKIDMLIQLKNQYSVKPTAKIHPGRTTVSQAIPKTFSGPPSLTPNDDRDLTLKELERLSTVSDRQVTTTLAKLRALQSTNEPLSAAQTESLKSQIKRSLMARFELQLKQLDYAQQDLDLAKHRLQDRLKNMERLTQDRMKELLPFK